MVAEIYEYQYTQTFPNPHMPPSIKTTGLRCLGNVYLSETKTMVCVKLEGSQRRHDTDLSTAVSFSKKGSFFLASCKESLRAKRGGKGHSSREILLHISGEETTGQRSLLCNVSTLWQTRTQSNSITDVPCFIFFYIQKKCLQMDALFNI